ncbi:MAG: Holliday junction resolvase RuvX [Clostridia bacterium]|nr:Holliday junction resolvase RuvX [Clostridia bacterium]
MTTRVYLIRHAQAEGNLTRRFHGVTDADLTPTGEKQLEYLKKRCAEYRFDAAYSSPLKRAKKTALAAIGDRDLELNTDPCLLEMNIGALEDVPYAELPVRFAEDFRLWTNEPHRFKAPGGETMEQVRDRIYNGFMDIVRKNAGKSILVVSHGCAMRALLCALKGIDFDKIGTIPWCDNTAVYVIDFDDDFKPTFLLDADVSHLPEELTTFRRQSWWKETAHGLATRMLGVDYGDARTGLALSDESKTLASPAGTIKEADPEKLIDKISAFAHENNCCQIIVGLPLNMNGTRGPRAEKAAAFGFELEMRSGISVYFWDERLTTVGAAAYMNATDFKGKKRKENIDTASACLILQGYLDYIRKR